MCIGCGGSDHKGRATYYVEHCSCDHDAQSAELEAIEAAAAAELCTICGHMRCQHEPVCWCDDHEFSREGVTPEG